MKAQGSIPVYGVHSLAYRHSPLALGLIVAYSRSYKNGSFNDTCEFVPALLTSERVARDVVSRYGAGIFLFSNYLWNSNQNLELAKLVKRWHPESITIHGGPSVPKYDHACQSFLEANPYVDIAVRGEGEVTTAELLEQIVSHRDEMQQDPCFLADVAGITYRQDPSGQAGRVFRTRDRERTQDLDGFPSPYLSGWFRSEDAENWVAAIVETNRGCPYGCTFCDWGSATLSKIRQFNLERVYGELEWIARHRVSILWIADANFGVLRRDVHIAQIIADLRRKYGCPKQVVVNYAKNASQRLAEIVKILHSAGVKTDGIISIQTQDRQTLENIDRSNIKTVRYEELIEIFQSQKLPVSSDLMIGLPGATVESFKADLQFFFDRKVFAKAYPTMLLPNSPMAHPDYMKKYRITTDMTGHVVSTYSYTRADRWAMQLIYSFYKVLVGFSVLKYFLYYLQADHGVQALTFIDDLRKRLKEAPCSLPWTSALLQPILNTPYDQEWTRATYRWSAEDWTFFHHEIMDFVLSSYGIVPDAAMNTILSVQAILMPRGGRILPETLQVQHDITAYFQEIHSLRSLSQIGHNSHRKLSEYSPGMLEVSDHGGLCQGILDEKYMYDTHSLDWELTSALMFSEGVQHFVS
ncbi:MAG: hypothetical protein DMG06_11960 [Acidobacteria bacterium]|nr:MAG: hypothetical protein DMG06_11960 [Acidobacteriota bacterium]